MLLLLVALIGTLELGLRWVYPLHWDVVRISDTHPRFGWVLAPGASYVYQLAEESVPVSYNAEGWRDRPRAKDKAEGVVRVLVLGNSFMEAYSVRFEDALSARLEHLTSTAERRVEVINFGVGGTAPCRNIWCSTLFGPAYQPDVVVFARRCPCATT